MGNWDRLSDFLFSLLGYAIIIFVTTTFITATLTLLLKTALNARNGEWGGAIILGIITLVMVLWLYFDSDGEEA